LVVKKGSKMRDRSSAAMPWPVSQTAISAPAAAFLQPVAARQGEPAAVGHGLEGIHDEVDEHLLQLAQVHLDAAAGAVVDAHLDLAALEVVARQHQAVGEGLGRVDALGVAGELARPRKLQQLGDDQPDAVGLLVDQADLLAHRGGGGAEDLLQHVEVALDDGHRVVDLVGDAGGELADGGEFFGHRQVAAGLVEGGVGFFELAGAFGHLAVELVAPALELHAAGGQVVEELVEGGGELADLVAAGDLPDPRVVIAGADPADRRAELLERLEDAARPRQRQHAAGHADGDEDGEEGQQRALHGVAEGRLEKADVEHPDPFAVAVQHRLVAGHVVVVHHEGGVEPHLAFVQHVLAHHLGGAGAEGALAGEQAHVGGDAGVAEEQGGGALAAQRQGAVAVDDGVEAVHQLAVAVEQHAAFEHRQQAPGVVVHRRGGVDQEAAGFLVARVGRGVGVGTRASRARSARRGSMAARWSASNTSMAVLPSPASAASTTGQRLRAAWGPAAGSAWLGGLARMRPSGPRRNRKSSPACRRASSR
jgi:hypothetical protein